MRAFKHLSVALLAATALAAGAQPAFPSQTIRIVVPFTAGSGSKTTARFFAERLARVLEASVIVDNRPGGNGVLAVQAVRSAPADGHTILLGSSSLVAVNPVVIKDLPYDPVRDLLPVGSGTRGMNLLVTGAGSSVRTLADAIALSRTRPGGLMLGTYSPGYELVARWLGNSTGLQFTNVPYKGGAPTLTDVAGGTLDLALVDPAGALTLLQAGKLHPLAVTGEARHPWVDAPTLRESGYPNLVQYGWSSFFVDAKTPATIVARLDQAFKQINASREAAEHVKPTGSEMLALDAHAMRRFQIAEIERFKRIAQQAGIQPR